VLDHQRAAAHPNGVVGLDHVVVVTPDLERTIGACEAAGLGLRRIRDTTSYGSPMRQAFFRLGPTVLEVVSGNVGNGEPAAEAPATWFGLAVDVDDLDQTAGLLGEGLGRIKVAVQDGRRIATFKTKQFDVSVAIAAMDHRGDR
jgi:catechol 2,3-dioxygenase-like lactoylglutathione lyase family enzyme